LGDKKRTVINLKKKNFSKKSKEFFKVTALDKFSVVLQIKTFAYTGFKPLQWVFMNILYLGREGDVSKGAF
jgi:hypothetical protein